MRNLKRALSLALAAIMLIGMMVVSASAVSYNDLTDKDEIVNKDAVSMLVSLGIIEGKPDGSYGPTENVDRAQMAKMLSVIMNRPELTLWYRALLSTPLFMMTESIFAI